MNRQDKTKEELIKELHELEQRVRELEASETLRGQRHIGKLIDTVQAGIVIHGKNGTEVIASNTRALNILGVTEEQLLGRDSFDPNWTFLQEDGSPMKIEQYPVKQAIDTKKIVPNIIMGIKHSDKSDPIWIVCTSIPELDENDRITQIVVSFMDISSLKKSEKQYHNLFENMMHEVHLWKLVRDEQGAIKTWKLVEVNPAALKAWGKNRPDIIGKTTDEIFSHNVTEQFIPIVKKIFSEGTPYTWEAYTPSTGQFLHMTSVPFGEYFISTGADITDRKQAEDALKENEEKLRELNAQKDKFFSIIAHDLRSPISNITGLSTLLTNQIKEKDYEAVDEYAMLIEQSSKKVLELLTNLLDWSRAQTGRMDFNPAIFKLTDLIEDNKKLFDVIADQKAITIKNVLPNELTVFADKQMINTVLRNLISNALKFTRQDGEITISAEKRQKEILISVSDNGIGIAPGRLEKLFHIGESNSTSGTNNEKGTGLGLILCKEFVDKHGGKIWVESEEGKGSTFYFTLSSSAN